MASSPQVVQAMRQAVALHQAGRLAEADAIYRRVLEVEPRNPDALQLLGLLHHQAGRNELAVEMIAKAIQLRPAPEFFVNLSQAYRALGKMRESLEACRRAVQMAPSLPEAWNNLGSALKDAGEVREAADAYRRAIQLRPGYAVAHNNLGNALGALDDAVGAEASLVQAIRLDPSYAEAYSNLGHLLTGLGRLDEAVSLCQRALQIRPNLVAAYMNLGTALHLQGRFDEGNAAFARGAQLDPNHARLHENLLSGFNYTTRWTPQQALDAHVTWAQRFAESAKPPAAFAIDRNPSRKLRIGYVSPDFKRHSVAYFLEPILQHHDRGRFEVTGYSSTDIADAVTERLKARCDRWRDIAGMSDAAAAELVRQDAIDVLIDLAGHTTGNRLGLFGLRPAPVQVTYLGYPSTTGLSTIDYRITDGLCDPPGLTEAFHSERLLRIDPPFICYRPPEDAPPVADPPALRNGFVTFGSFNKIAKAGPETIELWAKVLRATPTSRLLLKSRGLSSEGSRRRLLDSFARHSIDAARIELVEGDQPLASHLAMYGRLDVALDTFPYHGTTTTCEALWMGVPVISLAGQTHVARVGASLLSAVGRPEWVAASGADFVAAAQSWAADADGLARTRQTVRKEVARSPLCDGPRLTRALEAAYTKAFASWAGDLPLR